MRSEKSFIKNYIEWELAYSNFRKHSKLPFNSDSRKLFNKFMRVHILNGMMEEETYRKVELLNGPDAYTVIKIWYSKQK